MMASVYKLENEVTEVYEHIQNFISQLESEETKKSYKSSIGHFFKVIKGKKVSELTFNDIQLKIKNVDDYVSYLLDYEEKTAATVNKKMSAIKSLVNYLYPRDIVDSNTDKAVRSFKRRKEETEGYDSLTHNEVLRMIELAKTKEQGKLKELLIKLALDTCLRKSELLSLKWSDFIDIEGEKDIRFSGYGKGKKQFKKAIGRKLYNELLELNTGESELVFNITKNHFHESMKELIKELNISSNRKIVFHSIRKAGAKIHYINSGKDIRYVQSILGHSDPKTTAIYLEVDDYGALGAISSNGEIDLNIINEASHEDLLKAIESMDSSFKVLLANKIRQNNN
ncbi:tyrosine-type recombinase/integrase [Priestia megaterium]|uniref:tyrosine-type recombinase/integrase n=1 Tax=Priestia megaterium TaxID=1404 RepID=UPI002877A560|nr:tyrosine-type recombinase/integrase [Priestia megaterium]